jgi:hypothetical protein
VERGRSLAAPDFSDGLSIPAQGWEGEYSKVV